MATLSITLCEHGCEPYSKEAKNFTVPGLSANEANMMCLALKVAMRRGFPNSGDRSWFFSVR